MLFLKKLQQKYASDIIFIEMLYYVYYNSNGAMLEVFFKYFGTASKQGNRQICHPTQSHHNVAHVEKFVAIGPPSKGNSYCILNL